jgi:XapX domain-containing protein
VKTMLLSMLSGVALGAIFSFFKLPLPAPVTLAGVIGVFGVWLGYIIIETWI